MGPPKADGAERRGGGGLSDRVMSNRPDFERARQYALQRLATELSSAYGYHSIWHTRDDVAPAVERLAALEGVSAGNLLLVRTAAYFHDLGYIEQREGHEAISARMAAEAVPGFGYRPEQIAVIGGLILATRLPQRPTTALEEILADADLDVLGRDDFQERSDLLRAELEAFGLSFSVAQWHQDQMQFVRQHRYFTAAARALRDTGKERNLQALARRIAVG